MLICAPYAAPREPLPSWGADGSGELICRAVTNETHDVRSFHFAAERPARFAFDPGQFLTLELTIQGTTVYRCYTISSPPSRSGAICITVKRVPNGLVSNWLHETLRPGMTVRAAGPSGAFVPPPDGLEKLLFLSAGSGITPLISMARTLYDHADDRDVVFVHSARTPADILFRDELPLLARRLPRLRVAHVVSRAGNEPGWPGLLGRLDGPALSLLAPDLRERAVYCCGPAPYRTSVRALLAQAGADLSRYHEESFSFEAPPDAAVQDTRAPDADDAPSFNVTFARSGRTIACGPRTTLLAAAKAAGIGVPSSCTRGVCGTCKSGMLSGRVDMRHGGAIRPREIAQGLILPCCSTPLEDVVIDR